MLAKKIHFLVLTLISTIIFSVVLAETAFAEVPLLAEWLANGSEITSNRNIDLRGSFKFEDTETTFGRAAVKCSVIFDGTVGPNGLGEILKVLNLKGEEVGPLSMLPLLGEGANSDCQSVIGWTEGTTTSPIEVYPFSTPWKIELFLMENGEFLVLFSSATILRYEVLGLILAMNTEDSCEFSDGEILVENDPTTGDADTPNRSTFSPNSPCTMSGSKTTGVTETSELLSYELEGALLTVSSV